MPETPEILTKAAAVIDERGWFRGHYRDPFGRGVCIVGAISVAAGQAPDALGNGTATKEIHDAIGAFEGWLRAALDLTDWNDELAEDAAEVTTALRECAAELAKGATS